MIWGESQYGMQIGCFLPEENITFNNSLVSSNNKRSEMQQHLPPRVGPGTKLEVALLVVKGEPGDVDLARRLGRKSYEQIYITNLYYFILLARRLRRKSFEQIYITRKPMSHGCIKAFEVLGTKMLFTYLEKDNLTETKQ